MSSSNSSVTLDTQQTVTEKVSCVNIKNDDDNSSRLESFKTLNDLNVLLDAAQFTTLEFQSFEINKQKIHGADYQYSLPLQQQLDFLKITDNVKFPGACLDYSLKKFKTIKRAEIVLPSSATPLNFNTLLNLTFELLGKISNFELKFMVRKEYSVLVSSLKNLNENISIEKCGEIYTISRL
ncbi:hypothetical protein [Parasitella parasitica]|uniref:Uncharacterized protein n=1 Tax=Parasitella parasitica TaxID=35722 RepID=A0A0B7NBT3_9FUNG|nr:hypothetical protein [Parasitella parasitica]